MPLHFYRSFFFFSINEFSRIKRGIYIQRTKECNVHPYILISLVTVYLHSGLLHPQSIKSKFQPNSPANSMANVQLQFIHNRICVMHCTQIQRSNDWKIHKSCQHQNRSKPNWLRDSMSNPPHYLLNILYWNWKFHILTFYTIWMGGDHFKWHLHLMVCYHPYTDSYTFAY